MLITAFADQKMSSQLTNLVLVLDSTNYQQWSATMQPFLMSQAQWKCTKPGASASGITTAEAETEAEGEPSTTVTATISKEDLASWNKDAEKVLGNIRLRLHHTIGYQFNDVMSPSKLWETLKVRYGTVGLTQTFVKFKSIMDTVIPNGVDPSPALDKIMSHYTRPLSIRWEFPKKILVMMLLAKAPSSMETVVQMFSQLLADAGPDKVQEEMTPTKVVFMMRTAWDTHGRAGMLSQSNQQQVNKLSTVKPAGNQPPQF